MSIISTPRTCYDLLSANADPVYDGWGYQHTAIMTIVLGEHKSVADLTQSTLKMIRQDGLQANKCSTILQVTTLKPFTHVCRSQISSSPSSCPRGDWPPGYYGP